MPVFRLELVFGKKMQQLFEKTRDFELLFRAFFFVLERPFALQQGSK
jgi:hypothetical protein